jgi:dTDP-4-amino-4,6-dideoxygalactose transaminase
VLVDIDPLTFNIDPERIEAAITPRTRAIIPVHFAGLACDMAAVGEIARRHGLRVVEDAAHALPTRCNGRLVGAATSDATVFSFYASKTMTTGEGGMVTFADAAVARTARTMRLHGISRDVFARRSAGRHWEYEIVAPGLKANMSDILAAIGVVQLQRVWASHASRERLWRAYNLGLRDLPVMTAPEAPTGDVHAMHLYPARLLDDAPLDRDAFIAEMARAGVNCGVHFIPLHLHRFWRERLGLETDRFPHAQRAFEREVSLPLFATMSEAQQGLVLEATRGLLS